MNPELVTSVARFLGISEEELLERHDDYLQHQLVRWHEMAPESSEGLAAYYNDNLYLYELISTPSAGLVRLVAPFLEAKASILDFGSGIGTHGIHFLERGHELTFVDLPSPHFDYLHRRLLEAKLDARLVERDKASELDAQSFDAILCFDVLEHVVDWRETIDLFARLLKPEGKLFLVVSFREFEEHAIHIASQTGLTEKAFDDHLATLGLHEVFRRDQPVPLTHPLEPFQVFSREAPTKYSHVKGRFDQGRDAYLHGDLVRAAPCFSELLAWNPEDFAAHRELARVFYDKGQMAEASSSVATALSLLPDDVIAIELSADIAAQSGQLPEAAIRYAKALFGWPDRADHSRNKLASLIANQEVFDAVFDAADSWRSRLTLASYLIGCRAFPRAEAVLQLDLAKYPLETYAGYLLGKEYARLLRETGHVSHSMTILGGLCKAHPERLWLHFDLSLGHSAQGNYPSALAELDLEEQISPFRSAVQFEKGLVWRRIGDLRKAAESFDIAARLMPEFGNAYLALGKTLTALGEDAKAVNAYLHALPLLPEDENTLIELAMLQLIVGDAKGAIVPLTRVTEMRPERIDAWFKLGQAELAMGQRYKSITAFNNAYRRAPAEFWPHFDFPTKVILALLELPGKVLKKIVRGVTA